MTGKILGFDTESKTGTISTNNGERYKFTIEEWKGNIKPESGLEVDFELSNEQANEIYPISNGKINSKQIIGIASMLFGILISFVGLSNIMDLIDVGNNQMVQLGLQMQGTSLGALWVKYGIISLIGIVMTFFGFKTFKKAKL
jgi:hypothetical protein